MKSPKIYNSSSMTKSQFFSWIRSALRRLSIRWIPRNEALKEIRRPKENGGRSKWEYPCIICGSWFIRAHIEVDHKIPCGSLKSFEDIGPFVKRLLCEKEGFRCLCKSCHKEHTKKQRSLK